MDHDARGRSELRVKDEDDSIDTRIADDKPSYHSWKKKYRKMRLVFDERMHDGEELYKQEQKALATARRLAIQKESVTAAILFPPPPSGQPASNMLQPAPRLATRHQQLAPDPPRAPLRP